jgi:hypothetical protein
MRRRQSIYHATPRLKCLSAPASIKCQIAIFGLTNRRHHPRRQVAPGEHRHVPLANLSYTTAGAGGRVARMCLLTPYGDRSPSSGRSQACRLPLHTGNTSGKSTRPARLRHCAAITLSEQSAASACLAVQSGFDAAFWRLG